MRCRIWYAAVMSLVMGLAGAVWTADAQASGLFDWLSRCGSEPEPQVVCYPMTTVYQTSVSECCQPAVCCPDPCCPPAVVVQPQPSFWQRLGSCWSSPRVTAPAPSYYQTNWKKVPVTSYRPVVSTDPVTGCPVTVMRPCTTYEWQPQRRTTGIFDWLCGRRDPPVVQVPYCAPTMCCGPPECVVSGIDCGCTGTTVPSGTPTPAAPTPAPAPYYAPPPPAGMVMPPSGPAPSPAAVPQGVPPTQPPAAADTRPTLKPADISPEFPAENQLSPTVSPWDTAPVEQAAPVEPAAPVESAVPAAPVAPTDAAVPDIQNLQSLPALGPPALSPEGSRLRPVPDPDATPVAPTQESYPPRQLQPQPLRNRLSAQASARSHSAKWRRRRNSQRTKNLWTRFRAMTPAHSKW